jgi:hypothetical protein
LNQYVTIQWDFAPTARSCRRYTCELDVTDTARLRDRGARRGGVLPTSALLASLKCVLPESELVHSLVEVGKLVSCNALRMIYCR